MEGIANRFQLTGRQRLIFFAYCGIQANEKPLRIFLTGPGGVGKTNVLLAIREFLGCTALACATTGAAAATPTAMVEATTSGAAAPAAWYADPSKRYELRYWDGKEWTEHVARGGQQFTDAPVA